MLLNNGMENRQAYQSSFECRVQRFMVANANTFNTLTAVGDSANSTPAPLPARNSECASAMILPLSLLTPDLLTQGTMETHYPLSLPWEYTLRNVRRDCFR